MKYPMKHEDPDEYFVRIGAWWVLLTGFREDPFHALTKIAAAVLIFTVLGLLLII